MRLLTKLEKKSTRLMWFLVGVVSIGILGVVDYLTGFEISVSLFYLLPITLVTWQTGKSLGLLVSILSAFVWFLADVLAGNSYSYPIIFLWNTFIRLGFYIVTVYLLVALKTALEQERELGRVDSMTGVFNYRYFSILLQMEIDRARRNKHPITVAYIDLDNFKTINDRFGHSTGDLVLRSVADHIKKNLRSTDIFARLGGDEFGILLPEANQESAEIVLKRIQSSLLQEMCQHGWPVTFSIGVISCLEAPSSVDEIINHADDLMYSVKKEGKNSIAYKTCSS
jgi:diguanylate cyclase (GGDEF)-like protein